MQGTSSEQVLQYSEITSKETFSHNDPLPIIYGAETFYVPGDFTGP